MKKSNNLYILCNTNHPNEIYAISEFEEYIKKYIDLFDDYFGDDMNKSNYTINLICSENQILEYLRKYPEYHIQPIGINNNFFLTEWEWNYYKPYFKELYEKAKDTIINLGLFGEIYSYSGLEGHKSHISSDMTSIGESFYNFASTFDKFVESIPITFIQKNVLLEPIKAHKFNAVIQDLERKYANRLKND